MLFEWHEQFVSCNLILPSSSMQIGGDVTLFNLIAVAMGQLCYLQELIHQMKICI